jgi:hypothetical protein
VDLWLVRRQLGEDSAQAERFLAQGRAHPIVARRRRVALVENQIDHFEHRRQPRLPIRPRRDLERNTRLGECPLRSDDSLRHGRLWNQERSGDLIGGEPAE